MAAGSSPHTHAHGELRGAGGLPIPTPDSSCLLGQSCILTRSSTQCLCRTNNDNATLVLIQRSAAPSIRRQVGIPAAARGGDVCRDFGVRDEIGVGGSGIGSSID